MYVLCIEGYDVYNDCEELEPIINALISKFRGELIVFPHVDTFPSCNICDVISPFLYTEEFLKKRLGLIKSLKERKKTSLIKNLPQIYCFPLFIIRDEREDKNDNEDFRHVFNERKYELYCRNRYTLNDMIGKIDLLIMMQNREYKRGDLIEERYFTVKDKLDMLCDFEDVIYFDYRIDSFDWLMDEIKFMLEDKKNLVNHKF